MTSADVTEAVLSLVERIPAGFVMSYGAVAEYVRERYDLRCSARLVGRIMALHGGAIPWHRVVAADGRLPPGHEQRAAQALRAEGVRFRGAKVAMPAAVWIPNS